MSTDFEAGSTRVLLDGGPALALPGVELAVTEGPDAGKRLRVERGGARIGSAKGNELCLADRAVSRLHCEVVVRAEAITLIDRGSTNGTFIEGRRVRDVDLTTGTVVKLGSSAFRIEVGQVPGHLDVSGSSTFGHVVGGSLEMRRVYAVLEKVAPSDTTILLLGETGTGKELVARAVHDNSTRRSGPFVTLDCGAIPETLIESEVFGHVRGSFTGATGDRRGVFEEANGGTLFIDEIGELPLTMQPKLLRALEARRIRRVGSNTQVAVDVRVIAATNRSLFASVNQGSFRDDLYYRLAVVEVELPPLRSRVDDIPALAAHFLERFTGEATPPSPEMLSTLVGRPWPGNVRELRNVIERSVSLGWAATAASLRPVLPGGTGELGSLVPVHLPLKEARVAWMEQFETVYLKALLERTGGNVTRAAALAGVNRRFLQRMMARLGVKSAAFDDEPEEP